MCVCVYVCVCVCVCVCVLYIYIKTRHLFIQMLYFGFFETFKDSIK